MKKRLFMVLICAALAVSTVGCAFNINDMINGGNQNDDDDDDEDDDDDDDHSVSQNSDSMKLYEAFLNGSERLYVDEDKFSYYDIDQEVTVSFFDNPNGYLIEEFLQQVSVNVNKYYYCNMESASYTYIDLGKDGEPELLINTAFYTEYSNINRDYVIKCIDDKLVLCKEFDDEGYRTDGLANEYGLIGGTQNYDDYNTYVVRGYLDADGEYNFWYTRQNSYEGYIFLDYRFEKWAYDRDSYDLYLDIYEFEETGIEDLYYKNYCYCAEIPADAPTNGLDRATNVAEAQAIFDEVGVKLYTRAEIDEMMAAKQSEIGLTDEIASIERSRSDYDWKNLSFDYELVNGITDVYVTNVDELMAAINNKATITLAPGTYNVTEWLVRKIRSGEVEHLYDYDSEFYTTADTDEHIFYNGWDDEPALVIRNVTGLTIKAESPTNPATIVSEPIYYDVIDFVNCGRLALNNLIIGHVEQPESTCSGDVVYLTYCNDVVINGCDLYGCGATGLVLYSSYGIEMRDTVIHDCTYGAVNMNYADLKAYDCTFRDIDGWNLFWMSNSYVSYTDCTFSHLYGNYLDEGGDYNSAYYVNCTMDQDMTDYLTAMQAAGCDWIIIN
ncbi:MAG: right-handed parallel beta-helix repeat-containing protein [Lachnospiraceae bacterium]|nr:right-handed parallel beta-helix repeat-containing protein [Lachnospiraceae bacterium]